MNLRCRLGRHSKTRTVEVAVWSSGSAMEITRCARCDEVLHIKSIEVEANE